MSTSIFESARNWSFTPQDEKAAVKLNLLRQQTTSALPQSYKTNQILCLFEQIKATPLYKTLKTIPKGVLHHLHFDCAEDEEFYVKHVIPDPIVYLAKDLKSFKLGTKQQAEAEGWVAMSQARAQFQSEDQFIKHVCNLTMMNNQERAYNLKATVNECWDAFEVKISNFFPILGAMHILKKYVIHVLTKYVHNGYDRLQFRSLLTRLKQYNEAGEVVQQHEEKKFMEVFDEVYEVVRKEHPSLTVGFVFFGLKVLPAEENQKLLTTVLEKQWPKTVGIDFVQEEDLYGPQTPYDQVANKVLAKFPHLNIKKAYHVGETLDHINNNVEIALNAGVVRIGHGFNIIHHPQLIPVAKEKGVCFEKSPVSNICLGYVKDPRTGTAQVLLGLGLAVSINPDDPGKFGLEDCTMDFFITFVSTNWDLRHLKLTAIHSINHAICSEEIRQNTLNSFNHRWNSWVQAFIQE